MGQGAVGVVVQTAVLEQSPQLHAVHGVRVVGAVGQTQARVVVVDLVQGANVAHNHVNGLGVVEVRGQESLGAVGVNSRGRDVEPDPGPRSSCRSCTGR